MSMGLDVDQAVLVLLAFLAAGVTAIVLRKGMTRRTVHAWEQGLLYVDGLFVRELPPSRYRVWGLKERLVVTLPRFPNPETVHHIDVTSAERLSYRMSATLVFDIVDPRLAYEGGYREMLRLAASEAVTLLAAARSVEAVLAERATLSATLLAMLDAPICGCRVKQVFVQDVTLPPELRRLFTEIEKARLDGLAALERARGEQAALRSLSNAARMLKGNPELMSLRILQTLSSPGLKGATLVLGRDALAVSDAGPDSAP